MATTNLETENMSQVERMRRASILCCHFVRNLAYFRVGHVVFKSAPEGEFWLTVIGNFIDIAVLDWCTLFGNHSDKQHWKQLILDHEAFREALKKQTGITPEKWHSSWSEVTLYRNEFVAHLGSENIMHVPDMNIPQSMVEFYYQSLRTDGPAAFFQDLPDSLRDYYDFHCVEAQKYYSIYINQEKH
ncbi:MAG: hypothetical protein JO126_06740 [Alphaproteobacteria bacterium]|nr:hypothetical protein [Alphaproteobacteria bacterium]